MTTSNDDNNHNNGAGQQPPAAKKAKTHKESDVYDRQIRLWGAESQAKMQKANILYVNITGISAEVIKNLVLAGIKATIFDPRPAQQYLWDNGPHFLTPLNTVDSSYDKAKDKTVADTVRPVIEEMNPLLGDCTIISHTNQIKDLTEEDLESYTAIVASQISSSDAIHLSQKSPSTCHVYLADCFGFLGTCVIDLKSNFQYRPEQGKTLLDPKPLQPYHSMEEILTTPISKCINRFHKTPPKTWMLYRCLLEYYEQKQVWPADGNEEDEFDKDLVIGFLKGQGIEAGENPKIDVDEIMKLVGDVGMAHVPPVCAVLGGLIGNEIIKAISGKGEPANNTLLFDGNLCKAWSFLVKP